MKVVDAHVTVAFCTIRRTRPTVVVPDHSEKNPTSSIWGLNYPKNTAYKMYESCT